MESQQENHEGARRTQFWAERSEQTSFSLGYAVPRDQQPLPRGSPQALWRQDFGVPPSRRLFLPSWRTRALPGGELFHAARVSQNPRRPRSSRFTTSTATEPVAQPAPERDPAPRPRRPAVPQGEPSDGAEARAGTEDARDSERSPRNGYRPLAEATPKVHLSAQLSPDAADETPNHPA